MHNGGTIARALTIGIVASAAIASARADIAPYPDLRGSAGQITTTTLLIALAMIGAVAGWLSGRMMGGGGFGRVGDVISGVIGAFIAGLIGAWLFGTLSNAVGGLVAVLICAAAGAIILVAISRAIKRVSRTSGPT
jgi:uncharacterized membrane protein YeaQ/YmgE (transglycosylase-associated protein family)